MSISTTSAGSRSNASSASSPLAGLLDRPALVLERHLHGGADALVVLDGQDARAHARKCAVSSGFRACRRIVRAHGRARPGAGPSCSTGGRSPTRSLPGARGPVGDRARPRWRRPFGTRGHAVAPDWPSRRCRPGGSVLDVGCGPGRRRWPWCRRRVGSWAWTGRRHAGRLRGRLPGPAPGRCRGGAGRVARRAPARSTRPTSSCATTSPTTCATSWPSWWSSPAGPGRGWSSSWRRPPVGGAGAVVAVLLAARPAARADGRRLPGGAERGRASSRWSSRAPGRPHVRSSDERRGRHPAAPVPAAERDDEVAAGLPALPRRPPTSGRSPGPATPERPRSRI